MRSAPQRLFLGLDAVRRLTGCCDLFAPTRGGHPRDVESLKHFVAAFVDAAGRHILDDLPSQRLDHRRQRKS